MPYERKDQLPEPVRNSLPGHGQDIYLAAFNQAWERYRDPDKRRGGADRETAAHRVAWDAVKQVYEKKAGIWRKK